MERAPTNAPAPPAATEVSVPARTNVSPETLRRFDQCTVRGPADACAIGASAVLVVSSGSDVRTVTGPGAAKAVELSIASIACRWTVQAGFGENSRCPASDRFCNWFHDEVKELCQQQLRRCHGAVRSGADLHRNGAAQASGVYGSSREALHKCVIPDADLRKRGAPPGGSHAEGCGRDLRFPVGRLAIEGILERDGEVLLDHVEEAHELLARVVGIDGRVGDQIV